MKSPLPPIPPATAPARGAATADGTCQRVSTVRRRRRSPVPRLSPVHCPKDVRSTNVVLSCPGLLARVFSWPCPGVHVGPCYGASRRTRARRRRLRRFWCSSIGAAAGRWGLLLFCAPAGPKCPSDPSTGASRRQAFLLDDSIKLISRQRRRKRDHRVPVVWRHRWISIALRRPRVCCSRSTLRDLRTSQRISETRAGKEAKQASARALGLRDASAHER